MRKYPLPPNILHVMTEGMLKTTLERGVPMKMILMCSILTVIGGLS